MGKASEGSSLISGLMESGELFSPIRFTADEAYTFLKELPLYEAAGIMCRRKSFMICLGFKGEPNFRICDRIR